MSKVIVRDLHKRYGDVQAAQGVSFEIAEGEIFGLLGPNGSGKTTTLECMIGLRQPDAGEIEVCGLDARRKPRAVKQKIGAVLQTIQLQDKITPREALALFASFYHHAAAPAHLLQRFSLDDKADAPFDSLSGGQRQRLAVALAFVNNPELIFLDEPTTGLDAQSRRELHAEIAAMKRDGHTVLLTTHYIDEAEQLCDRIAIIDRGRIIASGHTAQPHRRLHGDAIRVADHRTSARPGLALDSSRHGRSGVRRRHGARFWSRHHQRHDHGADPSARGARDRAGRTAGAQSHARGRVPRPHG